MVHALGSPVVVGVAGEVKIVAFPLVEHEWAGSHGVLRVLITEFLYGRWRHWRQGSTAEIRHQRRKWLFQVARTTIADYWRAHYRVATGSLDALLDAGWEGPAEDAPAVLGSQPQDRVRRILQALPEHYREVLTCRFLLNLSVRETAVRMNLTEANVKVLQFRALKRAAGLEPVVAETL